MNQSDPSSAAVNRWLNEATRGLPANIAALTRAELHSHYLDGLDAHLRAGLAPDEAAQAALAALGSAAEVDNGLRSTHPSRTHLVIAMLACLFYPMAVFAAARFEADLGPYGMLMIQDAASVLSLTYIIITFVRLLGFDTPRLARPILIVLGAVVLNIFDRLVFYAIFRQLPLIGPDGGVFWDSASPLSIAMDWVFLGSEVLAALGVIWLGMRLLRLPERLFGLQRAAAWLLLANAPMLLSIVIALLAFNMELAGWISALADVTLTILLALMLLIFFRAAFRPTDVPLKVA